MRKRQADSATVRMSEHFAAFSFVDRITECDPGAARVAIPRAAESRPFRLPGAERSASRGWLQWTDAYRGRAALAGETRFLRQVAPGDVLELAVEIDDLDDGAVSYRAGGCAGQRVIELNDCLGRCCRWRNSRTGSIVGAFACCAGRWRADRFHGLPPQQRNRRARSGRSIRALLHVRRPRHSSRILSAPTGVSATCFSTRRSRCDGRGARSGGNGATPFLHA